MCMYSIDKVHSFILWYIILYNNYDCSILCVMHLQPALSTGMLAMLIVITVCIVKYTYLFFFPVEN